MTPLAFVKSCDILSHHMTLLMPPDRKTLLRYRSTVLSSCASSEQFSFEHHTVLILFLSAMVSLCFFHSRHCLKVIFALLFLFSQGVSEGDWKVVTGLFSTVLVCPHLCSSQQAPLGMSPWAHQGNGCTDLILVHHCTRMQLVKWFLRQRTSTSQVYISDSTMNVKGSDNFVMANLFPFGAHPRHT